jgi:hypothetical protein
METGLLTALAAGFTLVLLPSPVSRLYQLRLPPVPITAVVVAVVGATVGVLELLLNLMGRRPAVEGPRPPT